MSCGSVNRTGARCSYLPSSSTFSSSFNKMRRALLVAFESWRDSEKILAGSFKDVKTIEVLSLTALSRLERSVLTL